MEEKKQLRKHMLILRDQITEGDRQAWSQSICTRIEDFCVGRNIQRVGAFWPFGSEINLRFLFEKRKDWTFFFPRIASSTPPRLIWGPQPLEPGFWGLMEPVNAQHLLPPVQLLLTPGLVFDDKGFRLGYGKGFYDALLGRLDPEIITLAVGFEMQRTQTLPISPLDLPVHALMTEKGLYPFQREGHDGNLELDSRTRN